jgi:hypothetical protein
MAGTTYDKTTPQGQITTLGDNMYPGYNVVVIKLDFSKTPVAAADDNWKVLKLNEGWQLINGHTRLSTASTSTATVDIGTAEDGTELDAAVDLSTAATDWQAMDTLVAGTPILVAADGYIWLDFNDAAVTDGTLDIRLEIVVNAEQDSLTD